MAVAVPGRISHLSFPIASVGYLEPTHSNLSERKGRLTTFPRWAPFRRRRRSSEAAYVPRREFVPRAHVCGCAMPYLGASYFECPCRIEGDTGEAGDGMRQYRYKPHAYPSHSVFYSALERMVSTDMTSSHAKAAPEWEDSRTRSEDTAKATHALCHRRSDQRSRSSHITGGRQIRAWRWGCSIPISRPRRACSRSSRTCGTRCTQCLSHCPFAVTTSAHQSTTPRAHSGRM
ncbi:hypothetical protein B0H10DRAFT_181258 [Mycena sp. CBHHK59/15]|nr:hypothetical protein B0H10DRAFT_181258 [Mycena sp. CBHHK59/15]